MVCLCAAIYIFCLSMYSPPTEPDIEKQVSSGVCTLECHCHMQSLSHADCELVQREEFEEAEGRASANFKEKLQNLQ